jgi:hypothetical protein
MSYTIELTGKQFKNSRTDILMKPTIVPSSYVKPTIVPSSSYVKPTIVPSSYVKLTFDDEKFITGLNIDLNPWFPHFTCFPGKLYFIRIRDVVKWLLYNNKLAVYLRYVTVPDDAKIYIEHNNNVKFGANKLYLSERIDLRDFISTHKHMVQRIEEVFGIERAQYYFSKPQDIRKIKDIVYFQLTIWKTLELCLLCLKRRIIYMTDVPEIYQNDCMITFLTKEPTLVLLNIYNIIYCFECILKPNKDIYWKYVEYVYDTYNKYLDTYRNDYLIWFKMTYRDTINGLWNLYEEQSYDQFEVKEYFATIDNELNKEPDINDCTFVTIHLISIVVNQLVKCNINVMEYVPKYYDFKYISRDVVKYNWKALKYINDPSNLDCYYAISQSHEAIKLIHKPSDIFIKFAEGQRIITSSQKKDLNDSSSGKVSVL